MTFGFRRPAHRQYVKRVFISMSCYILTLFLAISQVRDGHLTGPLAWALAIMPGISVAGVFWAIGRLLVEEQDEYQRMMLVRQVLVATAFTLTIVTVYGFLENFGMVGHIDGFYVAILWFVGLAVGAAANRVSLGGCGGI
jgi:surface polysaccharide O-acyltransferase-like enzyme